MNDELNLPQLNFSLAYLCSNIWTSEVPTEVEPDPSRPYCRSTWDILSCWPMTYAGFTATIPCFPEFRNIKYDTSYNATRRCFFNATWETKSDYSQCKPLVKLEEPNTQTHESQTIAITLIYYIGYSLSLVTLSVALILFLYFKNLRCLRNKIHCHLILTYMLTALCWIISTTELVKSYEGSQLGCRIVLVILNYCQVTNFFWMFVEGLYLFTVVIHTFSIQRLKFWIYALIGWGIPIIIISAWLIVKSWYDKDTDARSTKSSDREDGKTACWVRSPTTCDYIYIIPILLILCVNFFFLTIVVWVLLTKMTSSSTLESKQYRRAAKGLLVLLPLLGLTYVLVIVGPTEIGITQTAFAYLTAILVSTQGISVSILYCFLNAEVRATVKNRFERWKSAQSFPTPKLRSSWRVSQSNDTKSSMKHHVSEKQKCSLKQKKSLPVMEQVI